MGNGVELQAVEVAVVAPWMQVVAEQYRVGRKCACDVKDVAFEPPAYDDIIDMHVWLKSVIVYELISFVFITKHVVDARDISQSQ